MAVTAVSARTPVGKVARMSEPSMAVTEHPVLAQSPSVSVDGKELGRLRKMNVGMGLVHLVSGIAMVTLGSDFELHVSAFRLDGPPGTPLDQGVVAGVLDVPLAFATAAFMFLSALFHFIVAGPGFSRYGDELRHGRNRFRWIEYSLSATLMIVLIALITGITDLAALIAIAFVNASMILFGWLMEVANRSGWRVWWTPFWFGCVAGVGPWAAIGTYLAVNVSQDGAGQPPGFVYGIIASIFVFFNCFAVNQFLQYRQVGPWRNYLFGERVYIVLSLVAKSALGWQIFANTLV